MKTLVCHSCAKKFPAVRPWQKYCSPRCKNSEGQRRVNCSESFKQVVPNTSIRIAPNKKSRPWNVGFIASDSTSSTASVGLESYGLGPKKANRTAHPDRRPPDSTTAAQPPVRRNLAAEPSRSLDLESRLAPAQAVGSHSAIMSRFTAYV